MFQVKRVGHVTITVPGVEETAVFQENIGTDLIT